MGEGGLDVVVMNGSCGDHLDFAWLPYEASIQATLIGMRVLPDGAGFSRIFSICSINQGRNRVFTNILRLRSGDVKNSVSYASNIEQIQIIRENPF
jgi:hypothetical protein